MSSYIDLSGSALPQLAEALKHHVEAVAADLRNEIVASMRDAPPRTGHEYPMRDQKGTYTASAPGEAPAMPTGIYAGAWDTTPAVVVGDKVVAAAVNDRKTEDDAHFIGEILEYGTSDGKIAPRPHIRPALDAVAQRWGGTVRTGE